jgi:hypothetical protein
MSLVVRALSANNVRTAAVNIGCIGEMSFMFVCIGSIAIVAFVLFQLELKQQRFENKEAKKNIWIELILMRFGMKARER